MKKVTSTAIVLNRDNIDTDQIIPAKFLNSTGRTGFGEKLFYNWRYDQEGNPNADFAFNAYGVGSEILLAGNNFGCGSSREHAAWAIADYGIKVVISSQFADIFKGNALNNGILPITVSEACLKAMLKYFEIERKCPIEVDLEAQQLIVDAKDIYINVKFDIDPLKKEFLMNGTSEIDYLVNQKADVVAFEEEHQL
ncbi:MAG: 3-isopropylmalate/(R)-2-methylmalate dehydratase small subunit [Crocinitomicaceae bacterium]|jgi:3-isopropylmalate/(R)-2-methylmalate dehydratase small subunit